MILRRVGLSHRKGLHCRQKSNSPQLFCKRLIILTFSPVASIFASGIPFFSTRHTLQFGGSVAKQEGKAGMTQSEEWQPCHISRDAIQDYCTPWATTRITVPRALCVASLAAHAALRAVRRGSGTVRCSTRLFCRYCGQVGAAGAQDLLGRWRLSFDSQDGSDIPVPTAAPVIECVLRSPAGYGGCAAGHSPSPTGFRRGDVFAETLMSLPSGLASRQSACSTADCSRTIGWPSRGGHILASWITALEARGRRRRIREQVRW